MKLGRRSGGDLHAPHTLGPAVWGGLDGPPGAMGMVGGSGRGVDWGAAAAVSRPHTRHVLVEDGLPRVLLIQRNLLDDLVKENFGRKGTHSMLLQVLVRRAFIL